MRGTSKAKKGEPRLRGMVAFRMVDEEYEALTTEADRRGVSVSDLMRELTKEFLGALSAPRQAASA